MKRRNNRYKGKVRCQLFRGLIANGLVKRKLFRADYTEAPEGPLAIIMGWTVTLIIT
jgi:hypothetical protein